MAETILIAIMDPTIEVAVEIVLYKAAEEVSLDKQELRQKITELTAANV